MKLKHLALFTAFLSGFIIMVLEGLGFRILAPYFGYSVYVSGSLIGVIMIALALGYFAGGYLGDKNPTVEFLFKVILFGTVFCFFGFVSYQAVFEMMMGMGMIRGPIVSCLIVFAPAMTMFAMVSPILIRLCSEHELLHVGFTSGWIYGVSTIGSIFGIFSSTFFLIPEIGSKNTFLFAIATLCLLLIPYYAFKKRFVYLCIVIALLALSFVFVPKSQLAAKEIIFEKESLYNHVYVEKKNGTLLLRLNQPQYYHSVFDKKSLITDKYYDFFVPAVYLSQSKSNNILVLGMGAGTSLVQLSTIFPEKKYYGVDIDEVVIEAGRNYFGLNDIPNLETFPEDAKAYVNQTELAFDMIEMDIFQGGLFIPFYLMSYEFFQDIKGILTEGGILTINIFNPSKDKKNEFVRRAQNTIAKVFPAVFYIDFKEHRILYASMKKYSLEEIKTLVSRAETPPAMHKIINLYSQRLKKVFFSPEDEIFTNDLAPVEPLIYKMISGASS